MSTDAVAEHRCPFCHELILTDAKKCKHCGEWLDPVLRARNERVRAAAAPRAIATNSTRVNVKVRGINHALHIFLCIITAGLWLPIYLLILTFG